MGLGLPVLSSWALQSCVSGEEDIYPNLPSGFSGKVLIIGAGAAGLAAGYALQRQGIDFQIIEAAPVYGGRLKQSSGFADFPIDLGAEWIQTHPSILASILKNPNLDEKIDFITYNPQSVQVWNEDALRTHNHIRHHYHEWKFKDTTWYGFFERYIVPHVADKLVLGKPVELVTYGDFGVSATTSDGTRFTGDKVLVTLPIKIMQQRGVTFFPDLPAAKWQAVDQVFMGDGLKIFVEFGERFYPDLLGFGSVLEALGDEEKFVYDAAFRKDSGQHILGLFAINAQAAAYTLLPRPQDMIEKFLVELDEMFDGRATPNYRRHIIQNWSAEPYIRGAYSYDFEKYSEDLVKALQEPVVERVYFAGEALTVDHQATVHGACASAYTALARMLQEA
jgi:monoamine oxidase